MNEYTVFDRASGKTVAMSSAADHVTAIAAVAQLYRIDVSELRAICVGCPDCDFSKIKTVGDALSAGYHAVVNIPKNGITPIDVPPEKIGVEITGRWHHEGVFKNDLYCNCFYSDDSVYFVKSEILKPYMGN